jgi:Leucine-rich repeat (LRR) protein
MSDRKSLEPDVDRVLDLTFLDIRDETEYQTALAEKIEQYRSRSPVRGRANSPGGMMVGTSPESTTLMNSSPGRSQYTVTDRRKLKAIRLGNNYIPRMEILFSSSLHLRCDNILWIDLSFNTLTKISPDLFKVFPNLRSLYLHANQIKQLSTIKHLQPLQDLHALTLYGNPVEENKHYRNYVLFYLPQINQFDKSPITKLQREKVI